MTTAGPNTKLQRILRLRTGEAGIVLVMGLVLIINFLAQQLSEITAISNFIGQAGPEQMLLVWLVDSVLILVTMGLQSLIIDRFNRVALMRWMILAFGLLFLIIRGLFSIGAPEWLAYGFWYLVATQQLVFFPVIFWILANDMFAVAQATRLFPLITSLGFIGRLLGIGVSLAVPRLIETYPVLQPPGLLLIGAGMYFLTLIIFTVGTRAVHLRQTAQPHEPMKETLAEGWNFVREVPAFRFLSLAIMLLLVCDVIIEFRFLVVSYAAYPDPARYQTLYALYRLGLTIGSILIQGLLTSRIISSLTLKNTFLIKPISTLLGSIWIFVQASLVGAIGGVMLLRLSQYTIDEPTRKAFLSLVPEERRGRVSIFIESYLYFAGTVLGCLITGAIVIAGILSGRATYPVYLGVSIVAATLSIWATLRMRRVYDSSLLNWRLKRRQRGKSVLDNVQF
jgi:AAA family ATP:ADP antiporter